jgi:hypothetical protein
MKRINKRSFQPANAFKDEGVLFVVAFNVDLFHAMVIHHLDCDPVGYTRHQPAQRYCLSAATRKVAHINARAEVARA